MDHRSLPHLTLLDLATTNHEWARRRSQVLAKKGPLFNLCDSRLQLFALMTFIFMRALPLAGSGATIKQMRRDSMEKVMRRRHQVDGFEHPMMVPESSRS